MRLPTETKRLYLSPARARPFLKWPGGKRALLTEITKRLPESWGTYWEPFTGGGALFFALDRWINNARLSDINKELVLTYREVRDSVEPLIAALQVHADQHADPEHYGRVRAQHILSDTLSVAARMIYLNRTCFNGLYRVNKKGQFNVSKGLYPNPTICAAEALRNASVVLQKAQLRFGPFEISAPTAGDFVYCDPPYDGARVAYASHAFGEEKQRMLRDMVQRWAKEGANVMVSNADTPLIRHLYADDVYTLHSVSSPRRINRDGNGRGKVGELLITTYTPSAVPDIFPFNVSV